jgi:hypothetical protein
VRTETYGMLLVAAVLASPSTVNRLHVRIDAEVGPDFPCHLHRAALQAAQRPLRVTWAATERRCFSSEKAAERIVDGTIDIHC